MGMAISTYGPYPRPKVKKVGGIWRVEWCDVFNRMWYHEPGNWQLAIDYALRLK